jgi:hypothetical protein
LRGIRIALHPVTAANAPEVKYVFRMLLRAAGFPWEFHWLREGTGDGRWDIYYGPAQPGVDALVHIDACGESFAGAESREPQALRQDQGLAFLDFQANGRAPLCRESGRIAFSNDIVFSSYWMLTGAREPHYARDRRDNLHLDGSFFLRHALQQTPVVSLYAAFLREQFRAWGRDPLPFPGAGSFIFTHDVDYPEMIRWIECLRLVRGRGLRAAPSIAGILRGTNHFWTFAEWVDWQKQLGVAPAFYFMARQGSLLQYALGTPDDF